MGFIITLIGSMLLIASTLYGWYKLVNIKYKLFEKKTLISLFVLSFVSIFNYFNVNQYIRIVIITVILIAFFKWLFKKDLKTSILTPMYQQLIVMISEAICILIIVTVFKLDLNALKSKFLGTFIMNTIVAFNSALIVNIPIVKRLYLISLKFLYKLNNNFFVVLSILIVGIANILAMITYYELDIRLLIVINVSFTLICFFIVLYSFKMKSNYNDVNDKYNVAIKSLKNLEVLMNKYKIANHENKNLLSTIRAMIINRQKNIPEFISSVIEKNYADDEKLLFEMSSIPSGEIRATIYSEIIKIRENSIKYNLIIDKSIKTIDIIGIDNNTVIDVCKILNVFIDNAIDEVNRIKSGNIVIEIYLNGDKLNIRVSNNYTGKIEIDKISKSGYTTKGDNHGYGLTLVKNIIDKNNNLENQIELKKQVFSQILIVELDNFEKEESL